MHPSPFTLLSDRVRSSTVLGTYGEELLPPKVTAAPEMVSLAAEISREEGGVITEGSASCSGLSSTIA